MPLLVFLLALAVFAQGTSEFMLAGLLPEIAGDLDISLAAAGLLTSTFAVGMVIGAPVMAACGRRWPPRTSLVAFLATFVAMHVVGALTHSIVLLLVTRVVAAVANAGFLALTLALVVRVVPEGKRAEALSVVLAGTTIALVAGAPLGAFVGSVWSWRTAMWAIVIICLPALVVLLRAAPRDAAESAGAPFAAELAVLREGRVVLTLVLVAVFNAATFCGYTYLAPVITETAGLGERSVPLLLALFGIGAFFGVTLAGRVADRHPVRVLVIVAPLMVVGWAGVPLAARVDWLFVAAILCLGGGSFAVGSTSIALAVRNAARAPAMGGSYATAALNVGAAVGPLVGGAAIGGPLALTGPVAVSAAFAALGVVVLALSARVVSAGGAARRTG